MSDNLLYYKIDGKDIVTKISGRVEIPYFMFGIESDEIKLGRFLLVMHKRLLKGEDFSQLFRFSVMLLRYCEEFSKNHFTVSVDSYNTDNSNKVKILALSVTYYGKPRTVITEVGQYQVYALFTKYVYADYLRTEDGRTLKKDINYIRLI